MSWEEPRLTSRGVSCGDYHESGRETNGQSEEEQKRNSLMSTSPTYSTHAQQDLLIKHEPGNCEATETVGDCKYLCCNQLWDPLPLTFDGAISVQSDLVQKDVLPAVGTTPPRVVVKQHFVVEFVNLMDFLKVS